MADWEETAALRYVNRVEMLSEFNGSNVLVLQQRLRRKAHMPITRKMLGLGEYDYEWRDVPTVMEEGE